MWVGVLGRRWELGSALSSSSGDCTQAREADQLNCTLSGHYTVAIRGSVRTARCLSLLSAERLPLDEAIVRGFDETDCECVLRTPEPSSWLSWLLSCVPEETPEIPEAGRGECCECECEDVADVGRGIAEGRRRACWLLLRVFCWAPWLWSTMDPLAMPLVAVVEWCWELSSMRYTVEVGSAVIRRDRGAGESPWRDGRITAERMEPATCS